MSKVIINNNIFNAITAISEKEQQTGLMNVPWPPPIMVFPSEPEYKKFWMKNTPSPLDIVFIANEKIVSIEKGIPHSTAMIGPNVKVDCVIEFPSGTIEKINASVNDLVKINYSNDERIKILSNIVPLNKISSRWKDEGYKRKDPYFNSLKYDEYITDLFSKNKDEYKDEDEDEDVPIGSYKDLLQYLDDPNVFITYTKTPIVSTNYNSYYGNNKSFNTPAGFYAYPIIELIDPTTTFAKHSKYVIVTKFSGNLLVYSKYNESDFERDLNKLKQLFPKKISDQVVKYWRSFDQLPAYKIYTAISSLVGIVKSSNVFLKLGYHGIYDDGSGIIFQNEPRQAVFFTPKTSLTIIGIYKNYDQHSTLSSRVINEKINSIEDFMNEQIPSEVLDDLNSKTLTNSQEDQLFDLLLKYPKMVEYVKNPSEKLKFKLVELDPLLIRYFDNPSEKLQMLAVKKDSKAFDWIENPTPNVRKFVSSEDDY